MGQIVTLNGRWHDLDYEPSLKVNTQQDFIPVEINGKMVHGVNINGYDYPPAESNCVLYLPGLPGQGATIWDRSKEGNDGTIYGATWKRLPSGLWYLDFDGINDTVVVSAATTFENIFDGGGTLAVWVKPRSDGESDAGKIISTYVAGKGWYLGIREQDAGLVKLRFWYEFSTVDGRWVTTNTVVKIGVWSLVLLTYNADSVDNDPTILVNGTSVALTEAQTPQGTRSSDAGQDLYIGDRVDSNAAYDGGIALPRLFSATLAISLRNSIRPQERHLFGV